MARAVLIAILATLAACTPDRAREAFLDSRVPPSLAGRFLPPEGWAWGLVQVRGAPAQRYGVSAPPGVSQGHVLILTGSGEAAEAWFETVRDLNRAGFTVWVLERTAEGGSERYARPRDMIHAPDLEPDAKAVRAMAQSVIKPPADQPLFVLAQADAGVIALRAAQTGLKVQGLVLAAPRLSADRLSTPLQDFAVAVGLGQMGAPGWQAWRRDGQQKVRVGLYGDPWRSEVQHAWQVANPDLRMSGPSLGWKAAQRKALQQTLANAQALETPIAMMDPAPSAAAFCKRTPRCEILEVPEARAPFWREADTVRDAWLKAIGNHVTEGVAARSSARPERLRNGHGL